MIDQRAILDFALERGAVELEPMVVTGAKDAAAAGVQGTPGFVIGMTTTGDVIEGTPLRGV